MLLQDIRKIENGRVHTKDSDTLSCPKCCATFQRDAVRTKMKRWGKDNASFYTSRHCPHCDKRITLKDANESVEQIKRRINSLEVYRNNCRMNGKLDDYRDAQEEINDLMKQINEIRAKDSSGALKNSELEKEDRKEHKPLTGDKALGAYQQQLALYESKRKEAIERGLPDMVRAANNTIARIKHDMAAGPTIDSAFGKGNSHVGQPMKVVGHYFIENADGSCTIYRGTGEVEKTPDKAQAIARVKELNNNVGFTGDYDPSEMKEYIVIARDPDGSLEKFLKALAAHANPGHSFGVKMDEDSDNPEEFGFDGDGAFFIKDIKVDGKKPAKDASPHYEQIIEFFKNNPNPEDDKVHALAEQLGMEPDEFETEIYSVLSGLLSGTKDAEAEEQKNYRVWYEQRNPETRRLYRQTIESGLTKEKAEQVARRWKIVNHIDAQITQDTKDSDEDMARFYKQNLEDAIDKDDKEEIKRWAGELIDAVFSRDKKATKDAIPQSELLEAAKRYKEDDKGFDVRNIEEETIANEDFRRVLYTGKNEQLVLMSINAGDDIGMEVHSDVDQFFRIEEGEGKLVIRDEGDFPLTAGSSILVKQGTAHNIINTGSKPLKLYTVYSPPNHPPDRVQTTKEIAEAEKTKDADQFDYVVTINNDGEILNYNVKASSKESARTKAVAGLEKRLGKVSGSLQKKFDGSKPNIEVKNVK